MNTDLFDTFVEDLLGEKLHRPLIIVGASKIDDLLFSILAKFLLPSKDLKDDDLLKGDNPISTFSSRIKLTSRLGFIDGSLFRTLEQIRKLRNLCAHSISFDIKKSPVREHILELKKGLINRSSFGLTKTRFFNHPMTDTEELQCILVTICVILEAINEVISKTSGSEKALQISLK
jgi:hypothetical protein